MLKKALVLFSGGLDSTVLLWWAKSKNFQPATLNFMFPGRRKMEIRAAKNLRRIAGCAENHDIFLPFVDPPHADKACFIPHRNLMYYSIAASLAVKTGASTIFGGHIAHDGKVFADARPAFFKKLQSLAPGVRFVFPFIDKSKADVLRLGEKLGVPFAKTWSCSRDVRTPCGECKSCTEYAEGFKAAGLPLLSSSKRIHRVKTAV